MGILGLIIFILDGQLLKRQLFKQYHFVRLIFSVLVVCWSAYFLDMWKRRERMFGIRYGGEGANLHKDIGEGTGDSTRRPGFRGFYKRSLWNNDMNHMEFDSKKRIKPIVISCVISFIFLMISVLFTLLILFLKAYFYA